MILAAPMSFVGSTKRLWRLTDNVTEQPWLALLQTTLIVLMPVVWTVILAWYLLFGLLLIPFRLWRRSVRKGHKQELQHREMLAAVGNEKAPAGTNPNGG